MHFERPLLLPLLAAAAFGQQGSYSFTGQLMLDNGLPVANAEVGVTLNGWNDGTDPVLTNAQGRFAFSGLPAGAYILTAHRNDLGFFFWGQTPQQGRVARSISIRSFRARTSCFASRASAQSSALFEIQPEIQCRTWVDAARRSWGNGKAAIQIEGNTATDDLGRVRISSMPRGRYGICASALQGGESAPPVGYATFGQKSRQVYAETCLPDAGSKALLNVIPVHNLEIDLVFALQYRLQSAAR